LGFFVSSTAAFVQFPQFPAPARCIPRVLSAAPVAQGGAFGMDPREIKRLSEMKRADEPLEEESLGLCVIGAVGGALVLKGPFGVLLGSQLAPMLATVKGPTGEKIRQAGWATWSRCLKIKRGATKVWIETDAKYDIRGRIVRIDAPGKWRDFDTKFDATGRVKATVQLLKRYLWQPLARLWSNFALFCNRRGITKAVVSTWEKTTIPSRWRSFEQQSILRMRVQQMRNQQGGGGAGYSPRGF